MSAVARRYYVRAVEELRAGRLDEAREALAASLELAPGFVSARVAFARLLAREGDPHRAAALLREGLAAPSLASRPRARVALERALGDALLAAGSHPAAEDAYLRAADAAGAGGSIERALRDRVARLRARTGRFAESLDALLAAARDQ